MVALTEQDSQAQKGRDALTWKSLRLLVINSYSIHYTKLYEYDHAQAVAVARQPVDQQFRHILDWREVV